MPYDGSPSCAAEDRGPWAACSGSARSPSREDLWYEGIRWHRILSRTEGRRIGSQPLSFVCTPSTYYASPRSVSSIVFAPSSPCEEQSGWVAAGSGQAEPCGPALPRVRRVVSFPNLYELHAWGAACEAQGYIYDAKARGYVQPVCPEGYTPADPRYPAREIWGLDLRELDNRVNEDDAYMNQAMSNGT